jgi:hypothetical protein
MTASSSSSTGRGPRAACSKGSTTETAARRCTGQWRMRATPRSKPWRPRASEALRIQFPLQRTAAPSPGGPPPQRRQAHVPGPRTRERPDALHEACHDGLLPLHYAVKKRAGQQNCSVLGRRMARFGPRGNGLGRGGSPSTLWSSSPAAGGSRCSSSFAPSWSSTPGSHRRPRRKASMRIRCSMTSSSDSSSNEIRRRSGGRRWRRGCSSRCTTRFVTSTPWRRWSSWFRNVPSRSTSRLAAGGASALHLAVRREPPTLPHVRLLAYANPDLLLTTDDSGATLQHRAVLSRRENPNKQTEHHPTNLCRRRPNPTRRRASVGRSLPPPQELPILQLLARFVCPQAGTMQ